MSDIGKLSKMNRAEFSRVLQNDAPENSEEWWAFHDANHYYEAAWHERQVKYGPNHDHAFRMKARRRYVKGCKLRDERLGE